MQKKLPKFKKYLGIKTRFTFWWSGLFLIFIFTSPFLFAENFDNISEAEKLVKEEDYKNAYNKLLLEIKDLEVELENQKGLVEYYKEQLAELNGAEPKVIDYKYNEAANRLWASAWRLQHDGVFEKMGAEKEEVLERAIDTFKRIVIDYPYADKAPDAQFRTGRIYFKFLKDYEMAEVELQKYLNMYPKGKYASDAKTMLRRIKGK